MERYHEREREQERPRQRIRKLTPEDVQRRIEAELARRERMRQERGRG